MGKTPLILKYLHDHARLVCDRRNEKDGPGKWRITAIPDDHRKNIIYHFGSAENYDEFFCTKPPQQKTKTKVPESPIQYCGEINLKSLERREMMRMIEKKVTKEKDSRITLKRISQEHKPKSGIFSNGIQANSRILIPEHSRTHESEDHTLIKNIVFDKHSIPSTSSIYLQESSDYEDDLFNEPDDIDLAQYHHQQDLFNNSEYYSGQQEDWFDNTANFTQSQRSSKHVTGFLPSHRDYYRFNSQR